MAFFRYTALRILVLVGVGAVGYLMGLRGFLLLIVAFLLSGVVSLVLLRGPREAMSASLVGRVETSRQRRAAAERGLPDQQVDTPDDPEAPRR
jgi:hypothetical protein